MYAAHISNVFDADASGDKGQSQRNTLNHV